MSPCLICACPDSRLLYRVRDDSVPISGVVPPLEIHRCGGCGLTFARGGLPEAGRKPLYEAAWKKTWGRTFEQSLSKAASCAAAQVAYIEPFIPPERLLDVGCGNGLFLEAASARGGAAWVELSAAAAAAARERVGPRVTLGTLEEAEFPENTSDVVTLWEVIEHVSHPLRLLSEVRRVLRPWGMAFLSTPNANSVFHRLACWSYALVDLLFEADQGEAWARTPLLKPAIRLGVAVGRRAGVPYRLICCARKNTSPSGGPAE